MTRRIRSHADPRIRTIPVIALTAHALSEEMDRCRAAGMDEFVSKPFQPDVLQAKILQLVSVATTESPANPPSDTDSQVAGNAPVDLSELEALAGDSAEFKVDLIDIFLEEAPAAMKQIREGIEQQKGAIIYQAVHALKPSWIMFRLAGHADTVPEIERLAQLPELPLKETRTLFQRMEAALEAATPELSRVRNQLAEEMR